MEVAKWVSPVTLFTTAASNLNVFVSEKRSSVFYPKGIISESLFFGGKLNYGPAF